MPEDAGRATAISLPAPHTSRAGPVLGTIKTRRYASVPAVVRDPAAG